MKKGKSRNTGIDTLRRMHAELSSGQIRPARAYVTEKRTDGSVVVREVDPECARKNRERIYP